MRLLSVNEYAREKGITTQAVYKQIERGTIKTRKVKVERVKIVVEDTEAKHV